MINTPDHNNEFEQMLDYLKRNRGFDFTGYKYTSLMRRMTKRMQAVDVKTYSDYIDYLDTHADEFVQLFNTILINVTGFFRDPTAWDYIASDILPRIIERKKPDDAIRIWSAGCASGEEPYTVAILLAEALGIERFREQVKIYASDVDNEALSHARQAVYNTKAMSGLSPELIAKYFDNDEGRYSFNKELRRSIIFGRNDLTQDAPISKIDLLVCRNTLMYFNADTQARILSRFHFALEDQGFLFLGKAEMLFLHTNLFTPVDLKRRIFAKIPGVGLRNRMLIAADHNEEENRLHNQITRHIQFREAAFDASPVAQVVVDLNGLMALANERARNLFGLTPKDQGRPLQELALFFRVPELRLRINESYAQRRVITLNEIQWVTTSGTGLVLEVQVAPLLDTLGTLLGANITFTDMIRYKHLQEELERANQELETAYEELQSTNEELETTNEELQSTIEELETTNEELQSTNEELETINEELQSTNEEMQSTNEEFQHRTEDLNQSNTFMRNILTSMRVGVVVVNPDFLVQIWNEKAEDLWGLRASEVIGKNFLNLDIGLPVESLKQTLRASLSDTDDYREIVLSATNRRGKSIQCHVSSTALMDHGKEPSGVILVMEELTKGDHGSQAMGHPAE